MEEPKIILELKSVSYDRFKRRLSLLRSAYKQIKNSACSHALYSCVS